MIEILVLVLIKILLKFKLLKYFDKIVTGLFVIFFSILWLFTTKYYVKPKEHVIIIYDVFGNKVNPNGIKTNFTRKDVALSFRREYQNRFPQYSFDFESFIPEIKRKTIIHRIKELSDIM